MFIAQPQTLIILIGPSNSGKSYFAKLLKSKIKSDYPIAKIQIVSSDTIRSELLDQNKFDKMGNWMYESSKISFDEYFKRIDSCMKFPIENDIIIADATNISMNNITKLNEIAKNNHYIVNYVVFYYKNFQEYFKYTNEFTNKEITLKHYKKLHNFYKDIIKFARLQKNQDIMCLRSHLENIEIKYSSLWRIYFEKQYFTTAKNALIIGDIHGKYKQMIELLKKHNIDVINKNIIINSDKFDLIIFIGDYFDKCSYEETKWMIDFVHKNIDLDNVIFLRGNHERFVYNYLNRQRDYLQTKQEIINTYFNSVKNLVNDDEYRNKFFDWYHKTVKFVKCPNFIVTHAPTFRENLCKLYCDNMIKGDYPYGIDSEKYVEYFKDIERYEPVCIHGHKSTTYPFKYNNRVFIDCGPDKNHKICSCAINKTKTVRFNCIQISTKPIENINIHILVKRNLHEQKKINFDDLDSTDIRRLKYLFKNDIKFISGTMPPAWATNNNIENINTVFNYYKRLNITELVLQPKYMGSRINIYLDLDNINHTKFITRNGFVAKIPEKDKDVLLKQCKHLVERIRQRIGKTVKFAIMDGELLPWNILGENLIENTFKIYSKLMQFELDILKDSNFDTMLSEKIASLQDICKLDKKEIIEKYKHHIYRLCKVLKNNYKYISLDKRQNYLNVFNKQLELYTNPDIKTEIKLFQILKIDDKIFPIETNFEAFRILNDDEILKIDITNNHDIECANKFFNELSYQKGFEGVVIKPNQINSAILNNVVPYFKVRNQDYLSIIYGPLYKEYYDTFIKSKNRSLDKKILSCIQEWNASIKMLNAKNKTEFTNAFLEYKYGENIEIVTDPRL